MPGVIKINPSVFKDERDALAVAWNEGLRLWMEDHDYEVQSEPTDEQRAKLSDTAYANDEDAMRKTVMARVITRDTSAPNPSAEQKAEAYALLQMIGDTLPEGSGDLEALELLAEDFEADYQQLSGGAPEAPGAQEASEEVPEEAVIPGEEEVEVPETDQATDQATDQVGAGTQAAVEAEGTALVAPPPEVPSAPEGGSAPVVQQAPALNERDEVLNRVTRALFSVESTDGRDKVGDNGKAVGGFMIHPEYITEANRIRVLRNLPVKEFTLEDRSDFVRSVEAVKTILGEQYDYKKIRNPALLGGTHRLQVGPDSPRWQKDPEQINYVDKLHVALKDEEAPAAALRIKAYNAARKAAATKRSPTNRGKRR